MEINAWTQKLRHHYDKAIRYYQDGGRDADACFDPAEKEALAAIGLKPINVFDYAEDWVGSQEPDWDTFLLTVAVRRDYFLHEQGGQPNPDELEAKNLPGRKETLGGFEWLPRIIVKARCFLQGALCHDIMYGCGGDRNFLKSHGLHPADFLRVIWAARGDDAKVLAFVQRAASGEK